MESEVRPMFSQLSTSNSVDLLAKVIPMLMLMLSYPQTCLGKPRVKAPLRHQLPHLK